MYIHDNREKIIYYLEPKYKWRDIDQGYKVINFVGNHNTLVCSHVIHIIIKTAAQGIHCYYYY